MIDLHLHTTASDGRSTPDELVREAAAVGLRTIAVTDHDTVAGLAAARTAAAALGLACVPGIEMTAVHGSRDVHILGYFLDPDDADLVAFLVAQRADRRRRVLEIAERLDRLGVPVDTDALIHAGSTSGRSVGRPLVAAALVTAGHAGSIADAFDRFLGEGRPAFVERRGQPPSEVIRRIGLAGGIASLAHPGKLGLDGIIPGLVEAGLPAIEVFHPDHPEEDVARYSAMAATYGLLVTGGSDYHGPGSGRVTGFGRVVLPPEAYEALAARAAR